MAIFNGTSGKDRFDGTATGDTFIMDQGGNDKVFGLDGDDSFIFGAALTHKDKIDGGIGNDQLFLDGDYSAGIISDAATMTSVEIILFGAGFSYNLTLDDANMTGAVTIDGGDLGAGDSLIFDGSADTDANFFISGGAGDDILAGGDGDDLFLLGAGGTDDARGGGDGDEFRMEGSFDATDTINGGVSAPVDFLTLNGAYAAGFTITKTMMKEIEFLQLDGDFDYDIVINNKVAQNDTASLLLRTGTVDNDHGVTVDAHAEKIARISFEDSIGNDNFTGGDGGGTFLMMTGGADDVTGGDGEETFRFDAAFGDDRVDGGDGEDLLSLAGDYSAGVVFSANILKHVEDIVMAGGFSYSFTFHDGNVAAGERMSVNASQLTVSETATFDGSAELDGEFNLTGGAGDDTLTGGDGDDDLTGLDGTDTLSGHDGADFIRGGAGDDVINGNLAVDVLSGGAGADRITGRFGADTFQLTGTISESTSTIRDTWVEFNFNVDKIDVVVAVTGVDARITTGTLNAASFDANLATEVAAADLLTNHAVLFTANAGDLSGHTYLVIERGGGAGYQANSDFVVEIENGTSLNGLDTGDFV